MKYLQLAVIVVATLTGSCDWDDPGTSASSLDGRAGGSPSGTPGRETGSGSDRVVRPTGLGELSFGMPASRLAPYVAEDSRPSVSETCEYVRLRDPPDSVAIMVEQGRFARIDVHGVGLATLEGARVGDSEERIQSLYPTLRRMPHKYTDGYYLVVLPLAPEDTLHRYVFETDGSRVTTYRAGIYPPVEYVEGCS